MFVFNKINVTKSILVNRKRRIHYIKSFDSTRKLNKDSFGKVEDGYIYIIVNRNDYFVH